MKNIGSRGRYLLQQGLHRLHQGDHPNIVSRRIPALANDKTGQQIEQQMEKLEKTFVESIWKLQAATIIMRLNFGFKNLN